MMKFAPKASFLPPLPLLSSLASLLVGLPVLNPGKTLALSTRVVYSQDANLSGIDLKVWSGYGLTINFIPSGEIIKQVWIGDPSRIAFTSNGNLCQKTDANQSNQNCNGGATVLFLRQIKAIDFPNLTSSDDGSTQITIITSGADGQKQYQFRLIPARGQPSYTSLVIKPDSAKPKPLLLVKPPPRKEFAASLPPTAVTDHQNVAVGDVFPKTQPVKSSVQRNDANAIAYGLSVAVRNGEIKPNSTTWHKTQDAIRLLRRGKSKEEAVSLSGIPVSVFNQLIEWGQSR